MRAILFGLPLLGLGLLAWAGTDGAGSKLADALKNGDRATALTLLKQHVDVNAPQPDGTTALDWAVRQDDRDMADRLIKAGADVKAANRYGVTPLYLACVNGSAPMIEKLLKAGADANSATTEGETALMTVARTGSCGSGEGSARAWRGCQFERAVAPADAARCGPWPNRIPRWRRN